MTIQASAGLSYAALLDRLTHHVSILAMKRDSYRLKQSARRRPAAAKVEQRQAAGESVDPNTAELLAPGKHSLHHESIDDGGGVGKGGIRTLSVDGNEVVQTRIDRTVPFIVSTDDPMDVGKDTDAPVAEEYETPQGRFMGNIAWVRVDIGKGAFGDAAGMDEAPAGRL
jgi:IstB-like ATP binding protein